MLAFFWYNAWWFSKAVVSPSLAHLRVPLDLTTKQKCLSELLKSEGKLSKVYCSGYIISNRWCITNYKEWEATHWQIHRLLPYQSNTLVVPFLQLAKFSLASLYWIAGLSVFRCSDWPKRCNWVVYASVLLILSRHDKKKMGQARPKIPSKSYAEENHDNLWHWKLYDYYLRQYTESHILTILRSLPKEFWLHQITGSFHLGWNALDEENALNEEDRRVWLEEEVSHPS